jgi:hypothetical protein
MRTYARNWLLCDPMPSSPTMWCARASSHDCHETERVRGWPPSGRRRICGKLWRGLVAPPRDSNNVPRSRRNESKCSSRSLPHHARRPNVQSWVFVRIGAIPRRTRSHGRWRRLGGEPTGSVRGPLGARIDLNRRGHAGSQANTIRYLIDADAHRHALSKTYPSEDRVAFAPQAMQVFENIKTALNSVGGDFEHVVKITTYLHRAECRRLP